MDRGWLGQSPSISVPAITLGSRLPLWDVRTTDVVVAAAGETSVEVVLPERRSGLQHERHRVRVPEGVQLLHAERAR